MQPLIAVLLDTLLQHMSSGHDTYEVGLCNKYNVSMQNTEGQQHQHILPSDQTLDAVVCVTCKTAR